jgi:hypothetical protein
MHAARLLESLAANTDFATKFVDQGGLQLLLRLYTLRHLPPTFGSSSAAHALVAAVRVLNQANLSVTSRVVEHLTGQLRTTLLLGMVSHLSNENPFKDPADFQSVTLAQLSGARTWDSLAVKTCPVKSTLRGHLWLQMPDNHGHLLHCQMHAFKITCRKIFPLRPKVTLSMDWLVDPVRCSPKLPSDKL